MLRQFALSSFLSLVLAGICAAERPSSQVAADLIELAPELSPVVARLAAHSASCARRLQGENADTASDAVQKLAVIDYSLPSTQKRFWLFDLKSKRVLVRDYVAHGKKTGEDQALFFSNTPESLQSSLGLFAVGERYVGKHGDSLRLLGMEPGINDLAYDRAIVIHGADYVSPAFIQAHGRLGRSFGCPALSKASAARAIEELENSQGFLFAYFPDKQWLDTSNYLNQCNES